MNTDTNNARLNRIEEKIDKLSDAMISLARAEEKLIAMEQKYSSQYDRMNRFSEKLDEIEKKVDENGRTSANINKFIWLLIGSIIAGITGQYFMMM